MADFRKWLFAFAVLALMLGASTANAQIPGGSSSIVCNLNPANPTIVSVENISALVGDYVLVCNGGQPTPAGTPIPQYNVTLTLNQNITSRLLGNTGYIDVLLTIDEPYPASPNPSVPAPPQVQGSPNGQKVCYSVSGAGAGNQSFPAGCNIFNGTYNPTTFLFNGSPYNQPAASNVFVAHTGSNLGQVTWLGVPIDAPGTAGSRIIRMTNIRANACNAGLSGGLVPTQINGFVSFNGSQAVVVNNSQQVLAFVQQGLIVGSKNSSVNQCNNLNVTAGSTTSLTSGCPTFTISLREGYAAAFKRKNAAFAPSTISDVADTNNTSPLPQNVPGFAYNSESGFQPPNPGGPGAGYTFGQATQGDRFLIVFNNVGAGVQLYAPQYVALTIQGTSLAGSPSPGNSGPVLTAGWTGGWLQLVGSASDLNGNVTSLAPSTAGTFSALCTAFVTPTFVGGNSGVFLNAVNLAVSGGVASAVYEVVNADPFAIEQANIPFSAQFISNTANNLPAPGQVTATASFAPLSTVNTWDASAPIPRWCNKSSAVNVFKINLCTCNLLFPFVTNSGGFDTGIAIANTSLDTANGVTPQNGNVTLFFYGSLPGTPAPAPITPQTTTAVVNAGTELLFTLSSGGDHGIQQETGFTGYIIAQANFQWCHGFAFISDLGAQKLAEGYLAIQLDLYGGSGLNRTGVVGEVQGN